MLAHDDLANGRLVQLPGPRLPAAFSYYTVTDRRRDLSENAKVFVAWISAEAQGTTRVVCGDKEASQLDPGPRRAKRKRVE